MSEQFLGKLVDRAPLAIVLIGVFVFIIGAAGGLPVGNPPLQITDPLWRGGLGVLGIILAAVGLLLQFREAGSASGDRAMNQVHKYSGTWIVQNSFTRWRSRNIQKPDKVSFNGKALIVIPVNGEGGVGVQIGRLKVNIEDYSATYEILNEVQSASVDKDGTLTMPVKVIRRQLIDEDPPPPTNGQTKDPYADLRRGLDNATFELVLKPIADTTPLRMEGYHNYNEALSPHQIAEEEYVYAGLFGPPGL